MNGELPTLSSKGQRQHSCNARGCALIHVVTSSMFFPWATQSSYMGISFAPHKDPVMGTILTLVLQMKKQVVEVQPTRLTSYCVMEQTLTSTPCGCEPTVVVAIIVGK